MRAAIPFYNYFRINFRNLDRPGRY